VLQYNLSQYDDAIEDFNHAIAASVDRAAGYYNRGSAYYALGQWEKAEIDAMKALELDGDDRAGAKSLLETVRKDVDIPPSAQQAYSVAVNLRADKKWAEAAERFGVAIQKFTDPSHRKLCICHIYRGSCFDNLSRCEEALEEYDAALRTNKDDFVGWYLRGHLHKKMGNAKRAREDYERAIELAPISGDLDEMCDTLVNDGMSRGEAMLALSSEKFKRAFKHAAAEEIGEELSKLAFHEAAADAFTLALRSAETSTIPTRHETILKCHRSRSLCYRSMGRHSEALQDINEAVKRAPSDPIGRYYRGLEYMKLCRWREADEDLKKSLELDFGDKPLLRRTVVQAQMQVVQEELSKQHDAAITAEAALLAELDNEEGKEEAKKKKKQAKKKKQKAKKKQEKESTEAHERVAAVVLQALCRRRLAKRGLRQVKEEAEERERKLQRERAEAAEAATKRRLDAERRAKLDAERKERERKDAEKRAQKEKKATAARELEAKRQAAKQREKEAKVAEQKRKVEEKHRVEEAKATTDGAAHKTRSESTKAGPKGSAVDDEDEWQVAVITKHLRQAGGALDIGALLARLEKTHPALKQALYRKKLPSGGSGALEWLRAHREAFELGRVNGTGVWTVRLSAAVKAQSPTKLTSPTTTTQQVSPPPVKQPSSKSVDGAVARGGKANGTHPMAGSPLETQAIKVLIHILEEAGGESEAASLISAFGKANPQLRHSILPKKQPGGLGPIDWLRTQKHVFEVSRVNSKSQCQVRLLPGARQRVMNANKPAGTSVAVPAPQQAPVAVPAPTAATEASQHPQQRGSEAQQQELATALLCKLVREAAGEIEVAALLSKFANTNSSLKQVVLPKRSPNGGSGAIEWLRARPEVFDVGRTNATGQTTVRLVASGQVARGTNETIPEGFERVHAASQQPKSRPQELRQPEQQMAAPPQPQPQPQQQQQHEEHGSPPQRSHHDVMQQQHYQQQHSHKQQNEQHHQHLAQQMGQQQQQQQERQFMFQPQPGHHQQHHQQFPQQLQGQQYAPQQHQLSLDMHFQMMQQQQQQQQQPPSHHTGLDQQLAHQHEQRQVAMMAHQNQIGQLPPNQQLSPGQQGSKTQQPSSWASASPEEAASTQPWPPAPEQGSQPRGSSRLGSWSAGREEQAAFDEMASGGRSGDNNSAEMEGFGFQQSAPHAAVAGEMWAESSTTWAPAPSAPAQSSSISPQVSPGGNDVVDAGRGTFSAEQDAFGPGGFGGIDVTDGLLDFMADPRVENWLAQLGLQHYTETFTSAEVDMDALRLMGDEDLLELGVTALGPRKKMLYALEGSTPA
jgi:tetratricopeptide (TPR) repeat protein